MIPILLILLVLLIAVHSLIKPKNYPPGPKWYPFIGCSGIVEKMSKKYGCQWKGLSQLAKLHSTQVLGLKMGSDLVVVLFGEKNLRQAFTSSEYEGRPDNFFIRLRCLGKRSGITGADGPLWKEYRNFTLKKLKNVGFGKTTMETEIQLELMNIIEHVKKTGNPVSPKGVLATAVLNILWKFVAGERIAKDRLKLLLDLLHARSKAFTILGGWLSQMPWLRYIFPKLSGYCLIVEINKQISAIIEEAIDKHKNKCVEGSDFIYSFLEEIDKGNILYTEDQLKVICLDLLIAGSQTTSNVLEFAILVALRNKTIQEKLYDEINTVLGENIPSWGDISRLHYTHAFITEVQRYYTIVPLVGPRRLLDNTTIGGYTLPKETTVLVALADLHFDPEVFENPSEFKPERYIDETGNFKNSEHLYPFGLGRRRCPGDSLARSFIFIIFAGILQKYKLECSNGLMPSGDPVTGIIAAPKEFTADFVLRT